MLVDSVGNAPSTGTPEREGGQAYGSRKATVREAPDPKAATDSVRFVFGSRPVRPGRRYRGCVAIQLATDAEFDVAHALDRALVAWHYEPTRFVISRHADGREREACAPDFYLPALDRYLEISSGSPRAEPQAREAATARGSPPVRVELLGAGRDPRAHRPTPRAT